MSGAIGAPTRGALRSEKLRMERALTEAWALCDDVAATGDAAKLARFEDRFALRLGEYERLCDVLRERGGTASRA